MAYIDYAFFEGYLGNQLDEETFEQVVGPACDIVDSLTRYQVAKRGLTSFPAWIQELFKKACAMQCAYFGYYGLDISYTAQAGQGFTVGKVSVGEGSKAEGGRMANAVSPAVITLLEQTGLLNRSVGVYSDPYLVGYLPTWRS